MHATSAGTANFEKTNGSNLFVSSQAYNRDAAGNLRTLVDRNGRTTTWDYDKLYRPTAESWNGVSGSLGYAYDTASRLTGVTDSTAMGTDFQFTFSIHLRCARTIAKRATVPRTDGKECAV